MVSENPKDINDIEVVDAVIERGTAIFSKMNECVAGELCQPTEYFDMINECKLCGRLC